MRPRLVHGLALAGVALAGYGIVARQPAVTAPGHGGDLVAHREGTDEGRTGSAAHDILAPGPFKHVTVEISFVRGRRPSPSSVAHLRRVLGEVLDKPVSFTTSSVAEGDGSWSVEEILRSARRRRMPSAPPEISLWIGFLDGRLAGNPGALGAAPAATVAAIFPDRIDDLGTLVSPADIERALLVHETGHLLGLVNLMPGVHTGHEDRVHNAHSGARRSVMHWAVDQAAVARVFLDRPPDRFDKADLAELREIETMIVPSSGSSLD